MEQEESLFCDTSMCQNRIVGPQQKWSTVAKNNATFHLQPQQSSNINHDKHLKQRKEFLKWNELHLWQGPLDQCLPAKQQGNIVLARRRHPKHNIVLGMAERNLNW